MATKHPGNTGSTSTARVLVMDDEKVLRDVVAEMLGTLGHEAVTAADGHEAVTLYEAAMQDGRPFDLVILDLTVPNGMGGSEAAGHLRLRDPDTRVIVSSGLAADPVMADYRAHGFCGCIAKPYSLRDLRDAVGRVLADRANG